MTGICGVRGASEDDVASALDLMLRSMWRRGKNARSTVSRLGHDFIGLGICDNSTQHSQDFLSSGNTTAAFDGFFYEKEHVNEVFRGDNVDCLSGLLDQPGGFGFVAVTDHGLLAGRDPVGQKPLYYGQGSRGTRAVASLKTALRAIGAAHPQPVSPGTILRGMERGFEMFDSSRTLREVLEKVIEESECVTTIHDLLLTAVSKGVPASQGVAFSGGLDSSVVAALAKESQKSPTLFTVGIEGQPELEHARRVATELGLPITILELAQQEVIESLGEVVSIVESVDPVVVGVSVPFYFACRKAQETDLSFIVAGQMSDELFGGYARFEKLVLGGKLEEAKGEMWESVTAAPSNDFDPGDKVAVSFGLEMRCPFAYAPLVDYALGLPLSMKVRVSGGKVVRKYALRKLALRLNLPDSVVNRPKKAVQYSSGVQGVLLKEARRRNQRLGDFVNSFSFRRVIGRKAS